MAKLFNKQAKKRYKEQDQLVVIKVVVVIMIIIDSKLHGR